MKIKSFYIQLLILLILIISFENGHSASVPVTLVKDGEPAATIIIADNNRLVTQLAVEEFNHYCKEMTGTVLPVAKDTFKISGTVILIGESEATKKRGVRGNDFDDQEYLIETREDCLILIGKDTPAVGTLDYKNMGVWPEFDFFDELGTIYAVYDFLERCCGIRWYLPTQIGEVVPKQKNLIISPLKIQRSPWTRYRWIDTFRLMPENLFYWDMSNIEEGKSVRPLARREVYLFWLRQRIGGVYFTCNHSFYTWEKRFGISHPEFFAQNKDGSPNFNQLNFANTALIDQVKKDIMACGQDKWQDANGIQRFNHASRGIFPLVPMDNKAWSYDERTREILLPRSTRTIGSFNTNKASNYIFDFVTNIAKQLKILDQPFLISSLAYGDYYFPPDAYIDFPDNLAVMVCKQQVKARTIRFDQVYYDSLREWRKRVKHLYIWEYYNFPQWRRMDCFPGLVPKRIGGDILQLKEVEIEGAFIEYNCAKGFPPFESWLVNPAMEHINFYFALKLLDTTERTIDGLLEEYYRLFYGPAEEPMCRFFSLVEQTYMNEDYYQPRPLDDQGSWTIYCPPNKLKEFGLLIEEAKKRSKGYPLYAERVDLMDKAVFQFMKTNSQRCLEKVN